MIKIKIFSVQNKNLSKIIRRRYVVALSIIAFLVILSQIIIQHNVRNEEGDSRVINIAGRQRMLSQRIAKDVYGIYLASDEKVRKKYLEELEISTNTWKNSHIDLKNGNEAVGLPGKNSYKVMELFDNIESTHQLILNTSYDIIDMVKEGNYDRDKLSDKIQIIENNEEKFLSGMDEIVFQYDTESKQKIEFIKYMEFAIMIVTFIILILEAKLIFLPAEKSISKAFEELKESHENILKLFETSPSAMFLVDEKDLKILLFNKQAEELIGVLVKKDGEYLNLDQIIHKNNNTDILNKIKDSYKVEGEEAIINTDSNSSIAALISSIKIYFDNKSMILVGLSDITKQKQAEETLRRLATYDELTGIYNRRSGWLMLENSYYQAKNGLVDLTICFLDVDNLKLINDSFGHSEGDWYIECIAHTIASNIKEDGYAFRYGGDEIVAVLLDCDYMQCENMILKIEESLTEIEKKEKKPYHISISSGIVNLSDYSVDTLEDFVRHADHIMYQNKRDKKSSKPKL